MIVLQINTVCGTGSTGRIATDIHRLLIDEGHESYIAYGRDLPKNCNNAIRIGSKVDNYIHALKTRIFDKHGFGSVQATHRFIEKVKEIDPDTIHLHNIHGYYINIEVLFNYLKEANKPVVWTLHDCWPFTGHCANFDYAQCDQWKTRCSNNCPERKAYPSSLFLSRAKSNFEKKKTLFTSVKKMTIVTPSYWLAKLVKESYLNEYSVQVINNGIDTNIFKPMKSNFREIYNIKDKFIVLGVANVWTQRKGLNDFIKLSSMIDNRFKIVLVGLNNRQLKSLPENILGIRKTSSTEELAKIYTASDVFFNPTYEDNYPTVNLESISCGTPVITYNTGGSPETLKNINNGFAVNKGDIKKVKSIIFKLLNNPITTNNNSAYNKNNAYSDYISLYKAFIDNKH